MKHLNFKYRHITSYSINQQQKEDDYNKKQTNKEDNKPEPLTLLLLHLTGGSEDDLIPIVKLYLLLRLYCVHVEMY